ncbi:MAG: hypothetical protein ACYCUG_06825 [Acidimicrobiales bacterium]
MAAEPRWQRRARRGYEPHWGMDVDRLALLHRWFGLFERWPTLRVYRVVAVACGALVTAVAAGAATRTHWRAHLPLAVATWALLGKVEGDARDAISSRQPGPGGPGIPPGGVREPRRPVPSAGSGAAAASA